MILQSLQLEHFKQYRSLSLDFREGLVGIIGKNGAGKSSLFEAILLCLFGDSGKEKSFYKSSWAAPNDQVLLELNFEMNQKSYRVRREFRGKALAHQAFLYDQQDQLLASGAMPVSDEISRLLGMDKEAFTRSIFSGQKELSILSSARREDRKRMVRKMIGLDNLDKIQQLVREDKNGLKKEIQGQLALILDTEEHKEIEQELKSLKGEGKALQKTLKALEKDLNQKDKAYQKSKKQFDQENERYKTFVQLEQNQVRYTEGLSNLLESQEELQQEQDRLQKMQQVLKEQAPRIQQYKEQQSALAELQQEKAKAEQIAQLTREIQALEKVIAEQETQVAGLEANIKKGQATKKQLEASTAAKQALQKELEQYYLDIAQLRNQAGAIKGKIEERQQSILQIQQLGKAAQCPTCFQPLIDSYDATLARLAVEVNNYQEQELAKFDQQLKEKEQAQGKAKERQTKEQDKEQELNGQIQVLRTKCKHLQEIADRQKEHQQSILELEQERKALGTSHFDQKVFEQLQTTLKEEAAFYIDYKTREREVSRLTELKEKTDQINERIKKGKKTVAEQTKALKKLKFALVDYEALKEQMDELEQDKEEARHSVIAQKEALSQVEQEQGRHQNRLDENKRIQTSINERQLKLDDLEQLDGLFQGFKTYILDKIKPTIAYNASHLFQQVTKGRYEGIRVDDHFEFHILENGLYYPIQRFSGGEIDLANLCLRIGISKAIAELSGSSTAMNFLGFDEIFGSQDEERRYEILLALDHLKEQYRQIYIISHIDTVKEFFPNILEARKNAEHSELKWL